jgi:hypothetical protein
MVSCAQRHPRAWDRQDQIPGTVTDEVDVRKAARHAQKAAEGRWLKRTDEGNSKLAELRAAGEGDGDLSRCIVDRLRPRLLLSC